MASIFSKIIAGEIPCYKIAEDEHFFAFLDINPLAKGHTLVVPKQETDYVFELDDDLLGGLSVFAKKASRAIEKVVPCKRIGVAVLGLEVTHAPVHLVPLHSEPDTTFAKSKLQLAKEEMEAVAEAIRAQLWNKASCPYAPDRDFAT